MTEGARRARNQQVARAGKYSVVAELNKRGAFAVPFAGNMPNIDLLKAGLSNGKAVGIFSAFFNLVECIRR
ncbi:MAG: hypothetical protein ACUVSL_08340 [Chloroflexus sp.]